MYRYVSERERGNVLDTNWLPFWQTAGVDGYETSLLNIFIPTDIRTPSSGRHLLNTSRAGSRGWPEQNAINNEDTERMKKNCLQDMPTFTLMFF